MVGGRAATREVWHAPAKINLWLEILGRRPDGYHDIDTCYQAIDLADTIVLEPTDEPGVTCRVQGPFAESVPEGSGNLAARAALLLAERTGHEPRVAITIVKEIPAGAGLGGGSSDAAAVLVALARRFAVPDPEDTLVELAAELGADVPFFLEGGTQRGTGIGGRLEAAAPPHEQWGILVWPGVPVSTRWAYEEHDRSLGRSRAKRQLGLRPRRNVDWPARGNAFERIVLDAHPHIARLKASLGMDEAIVTRVSGSGSALFALYGRQAARDAQLPVVHAATKAWTGARYWPFQFVGRGVTRLES